MKDFFFKKNIILILVVFATSGVLAWSLLSFAGTAGYEEESILGNKLEEEEAEPEPIEKEVRQEVLSSKTEFVKNFAQEKPVQEPQEAIQGQGTE